MVQLPDGVGLGVAYDWEFIAAHKTHQLIYN